MHDSISPRYKMDLMGKIKNIIEESYKSSDAIENYFNFNLKQYLPFLPDNMIEYVSYGTGHGDWFVNTEKTLYNIADKMPELLIKMAIDLDIEVPGFIPMIPQFKIEIENDFDMAHSNFVKALKNVYDDPAMSVMLCNTTLESIIKEIIKDERLNVEYDKKDTLEKLIKKILKAFKLEPVALPTDIKKIGNGLISVSQGVEALRSDNSPAHGKTSEDYVVDNPIYAELVVNSVATVGIFLIKFYKKNYHLRSDSGD